MPSTTKSRVPEAVPLPADALQALEAACKAGTQAEVARKLGLSDGTVSNARKGRYIGNVDRIAERIRGTLMRATVQCPVLGEITTRICQDERGKPFIPNGPRVRLWRACQACPHNPKAAKP